MAVPAFLLVGGQLLGYAKLFWDTIGKDLAKSFGPEIIKAAWSKFNGDNSQDSKLESIDRKKMKDLEHLAQVRADITEYRIKQNALEEDRSGKIKMDPSIRKQTEKSLRKLTKTLEGYYPKYSSLRSFVQKGDFNSAQDLMKGEIARTEEQASEAAQAVKEGRGLPGQGAQSAIDQQRFQQYTPEQQQAMSELLRSSLGDIQSKKFDFAPIEEEARAGFKQKTIPSIAERFSAMGSKGSQASSAFPQLLGQAGSDLEKSLASMKSQYNLQQQNQLANLLNLGLRPQYAHAGPLVGGLPQQQGSNIDKFAEVLPGLLGGAGDFISRLLAKKDAGLQQQGQQQANQLSQLQSKIGGSYQALQSIYPEAFKGKTVLPEAYSPGKVTNMQALKALYPQAFGDAGVSDETMNQALSGLGQPLQ